MARVMRVDVLYVQLPCQNVALPAVFSLAIVSEAQSVPFSRVFAE